MRALVCAAILSLAAQTVSADSISDEDYDNYVLNHADDDDSADPRAMPHPETGENGVWIPIYIQQYHLRIASELDTCRDDGVLVFRQREALKAALSEEKETTRELEQNAEILRETLDKVSRGLAYDAEFDEIREARLKRRTRWAVGSTIAAIGLALFFGAYAAGQ